MFSLYLECRQEEKDALIAELWDRGSEGITETDGADGGCGLRAFFADGGDAQGLTQEFARWSAEWRGEESRDWVAMAQSRLEPLCVGKRFFLVPEWRSDATPEGRFRIEVNPGMAFGTGAHETTQMCLEALEREIKPGMVVLDVGTGSGILSTAAAMLGAGRMIACDLDPVAVDLARQKLSFVGSADAIRSANVDLVVANISPEAIMGLAGELLRVLRAGGVAIVSGFEVQESQAVERVLVAGGAEVRESHSKGSWSALVAGAV